VIRGQRVMPDSDIAAWWPPRCSIRRGRSRWACSSCSHRDLAAKLDELERKLSTHDQAIAGLIDAIRQMTATPTKRGRPIGFSANLNDPAGRW